LSPILEDSVKIEMNQVHVWQIALDQIRADVNSYFVVLSEDERQRSGRFAFWKDRNRYIVVHGILRVLLSQYLSTKPTGIFFHKTPYGKPYVLLQEKRSPLCFNISYSEQIALIAISVDREVGIDIEFIRNNLDVDQLSKSCFSPLELMELKSIPLSQRKEAFFCGWTRKEAYTKARGEGLFTLDKFSVSLSRDKPTILLDVRADRNEPNRFSVYDLPVIEGYTSALVMEGHDNSISYFHWNEYVVGYTSPAIVGQTLRDSKVRSWIL
jgi:4'-phosphopantetheinyl transferase